MTDPGAERLPGGGATSSSLGEARAPGAALHSGSARTSSSRHLPPLTPFVRRP